MDYFQTKDKFKGSLFQRTLGHESSNTYNDNIFQENEDEESNTNYLSSSKKSPLLKLGKSSLTLYNEGQSFLNTKKFAEKSINLENKIDVMLSEWDTTIPSAVESLMFDKIFMDENEHFSELTSQPDSTNLSVIGEFDFQRLKKESSFEQICGLDEAKSTLRNAFIYPILYPQFFPENIHWNHVLLFGPPGTGKSLLAKAIAEEINAYLYKVSSADLLSHWHGETEKRIRTLFEEIRSSETPVILFFDEIDGLCRRRNSTEDDLARRIKTQLLIQFEEHANDKYSQNKTYLVGATNCPWDIDSAFLRRFHTKIYIPMPDKEARINILKKGLLEISTDLNEAEWEYAGNLTQGYSGSDLINIVMGSCCERLLHMMKCQYWKTNDNFWVPAAPDSINSVRMDFEDIPNYQIQCRPIKLHDLQAAISKTPKSVTHEELERFTQYGSRFI